MVVDDGTLGEEATRDINALRMRTQEVFRTSGGSTTSPSFEQIQRA